MNLTFSKAYFLKFPKSVLFSIARLFGLCLLCFGSVASADVTLSDLQPLFTDVDNISTDTQRIYQNTRYIQGYLQTLNQTQTTQSEYQRNLLLFLGGGVQPPTGYTPISTLLQQIASNTRNAGDVLASNPWWGTNSAFAVVNAAYNSAYPSESPNGMYTYSFPQFMSLWSASLTMPSGSTSTSYSREQVEAQWAEWFGKYRRARTFNASYPYTWFDWMADASRSNWVLQASVLRALSGISNAVASSSASGGGSFEDVLAANPWWATNSAFARNWQAYDYVWPKSEQGLSFPEAFSAFLASRTTTAVSASDLWDSWGLGGINQGRMYTWEDFIAEAVRSNMVLSTSATYSNLVAEVEENGYDTSPSMPTNSLPGYELPQERDFSAARSQLAQGERATRDLIANIPKPSTGGNSEIVLIPEFTVGGIHVREHRASLNSSIVPVCRGVLTFLYGVGVACYLFRLAKTEYIFYASLGRAWGTRE